METKLLLPHRYKWVGWVLLIAAITLWVLTAMMGKELSFLQTKMFAVATSGVLPEGSSFFSIVDMDITNTLTGALFILGGLLVAFSREKVEDEFIMKLRLSSFKWAVLINYLILLVLLLFVHGMYFLYVMVYNMFTTLALFIIHFNFVLIKNCVGNYEE